MVLDISRKNWFRFSQYIYIYIYKEMMHTYKFFLNRFDVAYDQVFPKIEMEII